MDRCPPPGSSLLALLLAVPLAVACSRRGPDFREVRNLGSDTMLEVAGAWAEAYDGVQSDVVVSVSGGGSGTGIAALIAGTVDLANSSRRLKQAELDAARRAGQEPVEHRVGYDAIAIYVHRDNPLQSITVAQLRSLFGDGGKLSRWSDIGVDLGEPKLDPVILCSRQNNSGTYEYFREAVLGGSKGRFKAECLNLNGSKDVVEFCSRTPSAIGYSGLAYQTDEVRVLPVVKDEGRPAVMPSTATVLDRSYPIARQLYMYTRGQPQGATAAYLEWICSDAGQRVLQDHGYPPLRRL
jgi:phosphate transport system substrate-binding protein